MQNHLCPKDQIARSRRVNCCREKWHSPDDRERLLIICFDGHRLKIVESSKSVKEESPSREVTGTTLEAKNSEGLYVPASVCGAGFQIFPEFMWSSLRRIPMDPVVVTRRARSTFNFGEFFPEPSIVNTAGTSLIDNGKEYTTDGVPAKLKLSTLGKCSAKSCGRKFTNAPLVNKAMPASEGLPKRASATTMEFGEPELLSCL